MRTKHLLTAMVLPALFAACSSEEFEGVNESANGLKGRVELGKVTLTVGNEAETRFGAGTGDDYNGFVTETGDAIGACLVDVTGGNENTLVKDQTSKEAHMGLYKLVNDIQTNYAFTQSAAGWSCEGNLVEGNYLFYLPYNKEHKTRNAMTAKLPAVQTLTVQDGAVVKESAIDYVFDQGVIMGVQHLFMDRSNETATLSSLRPVYAYPLITLVNKYKEDTDNNALTEEVPVDVVVKQIVIRKTTGTFTTEAPIQVTGAAGQTLLEQTAGNRTGAAYALAEKISYTQASDDETQVLAAGEFVKPANAKYVAKTSSLLGAATSTSAAIVLKPTAGIKVAANGGSVEFYAVIPGENYAANNLVVEVTTDKGTFTKTIANPAIAAGRRYPLSEYNANGKLIEPTLDPDGSLVESGKGAEYSIAMTATTGTSVIVATTDDLIAQLRNAVNKTTLNVTPLNKDVVFSADAAAAFKANTKANFKLTIDGNITLGTGLASGTVSTKKIEVKGDAYANGTVNLDSRWALRGKLNILSGATVNLDGISSLTNGIYNAGTLNVAQTSTPAVTLQSNSGTVNMDALLVVKANNGTINVGPSADDENDIEIDLGNYDLDNTNGTVNVKSYTTVTSTGTGKLLNKKKLNVEANAKVLKLKNTKDVDNWGTVAGESDGTIVLKSSSAELGTVDKISTGGRIDNSIDITAAIDPTTMGAQIVFYEFNNQTINGPLYPQTGKYNTIVLTNTTWNPTAYQELGGNVEMKNSTISVYTPGVTIQIPALKIMKGTSVFKGNDTAKIQVMATSVDKESASSSHLTVSNVKAYTGTGSAYATANEITSF